MLPKGEIEGGFMELYFLLPFPSTSNYTKGRQKSLLSVWRGRSVEELLHRTFLKQLESPTRDQLRHALASEPILHEAALFVLQGREDYESKESGENI